MAVPVFCENEVAGTGDGGRLKTGWDWRAAVGQDIFVIIGIGYPKQAVCKTAETVLPPIGHKPVGQDAAILLQHGFVCGLGSKRLAEFSQKIGKVFIRG